jgi:protein CLEC16A
VLQTLYILIQNLRSKTALYYVCSNNHVNDLVTLAFDFEDEEVLGYYINLLKSISLRLTPKTAQFFFMVGSPPPPPHTHRHIHTQFSPSNLHKHLC